MARGAYQHKAKAKEPTPAREEAKLTRYQRALVIDVWRRANDFPALAYEATRDAEAAMRKDERAEFLSFVTGAQASLAAILNGLIEWRDRVPLEDGKINAQSAIDALFHHLMRAGKEIAPLGMWTAHEHRLVTLAAHGKRGPKHAVAERAVLVSCMPFGLTPRQIVDVLHANGYLKNAKASDHKRFEKFAKEIRAAVSRRTQ